MSTWLTSSLKNVTLYDLQVYFRGDVTEEIEKDFRKEIGKDTPYTLYNQSSMDLEANNSVKEIYVIAGDDHIAEFIDLHVGNKPIPLPENGEVVVSVGAAQALGIHVGDEVAMRNSDLKTLNLTVSGIYDNHVDNFCIISPKSIETQWGFTPEKQMAFVTVENEEKVHELTAELLSMPDIMNVAVSEDMADMVRNTMDAMDLVIVVVVFCAGLLAATVLYNLTNININERVREIATIKVLGFNASETAAYVFKENIALTVVGSLIGLLLGELLLYFVVSQIHIDMVWFDTVIMPGSYWLSMALTLFAAAVVNFIFYFKLQKINMAEALKSVE